MRTNTAAEVAASAKITQNRLGLIANQLWGESPAELNEDQSAQIRQVADYMRDNGLRSVGQAIAQMSGGGRSATQPAASTRAADQGGIHTHFEQVIEEASNHYADYITAEIITRTMRKAGSGKGRHTEAALENFTEALVPVLTPTDQGLALPGLAASSQMLLNPSMGE